MSLNLIDDYWLMVNLIILGKGIPLFSDIKEKINVKLADSNIFPSGIVCLHHEKK